MATKKVLKAAVKKVAAKKAPDLTVYFVASGSRSGYAMCVGMDEALAEATWLVQSNGELPSDIEVFRCDKKMGVEVNCVFKEDK